jgi:AbrB family looped-hinge helix DNA binding protein
MFTASLDDKGRVVIPSSVRNKFNLRFNSQVLLELKKVNGCDSTIDSVSVCGTEEAGSNPARGPKKRGESNDW